MSGTVDDPIDLESLDAAITASDRPDSSRDERLRARRALVAKLKHLESGVESPEATHRLASALLTQLTTSDMPERFGLTPVASDKLLDRTIAVMQESRMQMGAKDVDTNTLQHQVSARGERIQQQRAQRVDRAVNSVRGGVSPTSPPAELSTLTQAPHGGPSSPLADRVQSALANFSSALGQPKRPSDGPDRRDSARQRTPAKERPPKRASDEPDRDQDAKSPKEALPSEVPIPKRESSRTSTASTAAFPSRIEVVLKQDERKPGVLGGGTRLSPYDLTLDPRRGTRSSTTLRYHTLLKFFFGFCPFTRAVGLCSQRHATLVRVTTGH
jgi:hypothetical protein